MAPIYETMFSVILPDDRTGFVLQGLQNLRPAVTLFLLNGIGALGQEPRS